MVVIYLIIVIFILVTLMAIQNYYRMKKIALERSMQSICSYARSFDYRNVDTKIMRSVYEKVQKWAGTYEGLPFPVQSSDDFDTVYQMDLDDLDDIYWEVADELGISTERSEENPYFDKVKTVKELVLFLHHQPRLKNA
jgi:hypothetical protein